MSFLNELESIIDTYLATNGVSMPSPKPPIDIYAPMFIDFLNKSVAHKPYQVLESKEVIDLLDAGFVRKADYDIIKADFEQGNDISKYLSKGSLTLKSDDLLWDWRIHHLHVETTIDPNNARFVVRSPYQLFFFIDRGIVHFLTLVPHLHGSDYSDLEFLELIEENWPSILEKFRLKSVVGLSENITPVDRQQLRKVGINTLVQLKSGNCYMNSGLGFTQSEYKVSIFAVKGFDALKQGLLEMDEVNAQLPPDKKLHLVLDSNTLFFRELGTGDGVGFPNHQVFNLWPHAMGR